MRLPVLLAPFVATIVIACGGGDAIGTSDIVTHVPFIPGERAVYALDGRDGDIVAIGTLTTRRVGENLVLEQDYRAIGQLQDLEPATDLVKIMVDDATLKPKSGSRLITPRESGDDTTENEYRWEYVRQGTDDGIILKDLQENGARESDLRIRSHHYDNESSLWLWRTLNFTDGYEAHYVSVNHIDGSQQTVTVKVVRRETIHVPAGGFDTWRLLTRTGRASRVVWISVNSPHHVVQWDNGFLVFRLVETGTIQ